MLFETDNGKFQRGSQRLHCILYILFVGRASNSFGSNLERECQNASLSELNGTGKDKISHKHKEQVPCGLPNGQISPNKA